MTPNSHPTVHFSLPTLRALLIALAALSAIIGAVAVGAAPPNNSGSRGLFIASGGNGQTPGTRLLPTQPTNTGVYGRPQPITRPGTGGGNANAGNDPKPKKIDCPANDIDITVADVKNSDKGSVWYVSYTVKVVCKGQGTVTTVYEGREKISGYTAKCVVPQVWYRSCGVGSGGVPMPLFVQDMTENECAKLEQIARAKTAPVRLVERARIVLLSVSGLTVPKIAVHLGVSEKTARHWVKRFTTARLAGLDDAPRSGRPPTYSAGMHSQVIAKARSLPPKPEGMDVPPTCHWTLDRLAEELHKDGIPIKRSQIRRLLRAEHLTWQKPRTWLESDDPAFAEKRGRSSDCTPTRRQAAR